MNQATNSACQRALEVAAAVLPQGLDVLVKHQDYVAMPARKRIAAFARMRAAIQRTTLGVAAKGPCASHSSSKR